MQLDGKVVRTVLELAQKLEIQPYLIDEMGEVLVSADTEVTGQIDPWLESAFFEDGFAEVLEAQRCYFKVPCETYKPLILVLPGSRQGTYALGFAMAALLGEILRTSVRKPGREEIIRALLLDKTDPLELQEAAKDFRMDADARRCVILVQAPEGNAAPLYEMMQNVFPRSRGDIVAMLNRYVVALVRQIEPEDDMDDITQLVLALNESLTNELGATACIGVGGIKRGLSLLRDSYNEAQEAINLGRTQQGKSKVFFFHQLLLERFLHDVPRDVRQRFFNLAYTDSLKKILTDEMMETIDRFFENNLNLSEAARKLYIHRNTLIYRLDKIQKIAGLDLRNFNDAVLLKIIIMLRKSLSAINTFQ